MSEEFKPIETQEQLDSVIKGRLERAEKKYSEATAELQSKYDAQTSELEALKSTNTELNEKIKSYDEKYAGIDEKINEMQNTIKTYESDSVKTRICKEVGLPFELKGRLVGNTEEELRQDAEALSKIIPKNGAPSKSSEVIPTENSEERNAFREMLNKL